MSRQLQIEVRDTLADLAPSDWNALDPSGYPFVRHEFLFGLETTDCLGQQTGWFPRYFLLWSDTSKPRELLGAVAAYVKSNSYGEFVFDWSWADAYERHGMDYYPKLVVAIPFTPATGPRILVHPEQSVDATAPLLAEAVRQFALSQEYSSVHWLFLDEPTAARLSADEHLSRIDCQFHWHNSDYRSFDDFLDGCTAKRRKTIRRERRYVADAKLRLERRAGHTLSDQEWQWVHDLYSSTYDRKWGNPSLTVAFFRRMGSTFGNNTLIVFAYDDADDEPLLPVACSILFEGGDTLYGRYWGCRAHYHCLHFEACYYQGIEHCIENGIARFEPGAQGEHKISRGFEPTLTQSAHYIAHPGFRDAIRNFLSEEAEYVKQRCDSLSNLLPFKAELRLD